MATRAGDRIRLLGAASGSTVFAADSAAGTLISVNADGSSCGSSVTVGDPGASYGELVQSDQFIFVPDLTDGKTYIVNAAAPDHVVTSFALAKPGNTLELLAKDGFVFYNDRDSEKAGVLALHDGKWVAGPSISKFNAADPSSGVISTGVSASAVTPASSSAGNPGRANTSAAPTRSSKGTSVDQPTMANAQSRSSDIGVGDTSNSSAGSQTSGNPAGDITSDAPGGGTSVSSRGPSPTSQTSGGNVTSTTSTHTSGGGATSTTSTASTASTATSHSGTDTSSAPTTSTTISSEIPPTIDTIVVNPDPAVVGQPIQFQATVTNAGNAAWTWRITANDGSTVFESAAANTVTTAIPAGHGSAFTVTLTLTPATGATVVRTQTFVVNTPVVEPPVVNSINITPSPAQFGEPISFSASVSNAARATYLWTITDSTGAKVFSATEPAFSHTFAAGDGTEFVARLTLTGPSGNPTDNGTLTLPFQVVAAPVAPPVITSISVNPDTPEFGQPVQFAAVTSNADNASWKWTIKADDGSIPYQSTQPGVFTQTIAGGHGRHFTVTLTVSGPSGDPADVASSSIDLTITPPSIDSLSVDQVTAGQATQFTAAVSHATGATWHWHITSSNGTVESDTQTAGSFSHTVGRNLGTNFNVTLTVTGDGSVDDTATSSTPFTINPSGSTRTGKTLSTSATFTSGVFNEQSQVSDATLTLLDDAYTGVPLSSQIAIHTVSHSPDVFAGFHGCTTVSLTRSGLQSYAKSSTTGVGPNSTNTYDWTADPSLDTALAATGIAVNSVFKKC